MRLILGDHFSIAMPIPRRPPCRFADSRSRLSLPRRGPFAILILFPTQSRIERTTLMGARRIRREQRQVDMAESRHRNGIVKAKERQRRELRLKEMLRKTKPPYSPT